MSATFSSPPHFLLFHGFTVSFPTMNSNFNSAAAADADAGFTSHFSFNAVSGTNFDGGASSEAAPTAPAFKRHHQNPRWKRSKMVRIDHDPAAVSSSSSFSKPKYVKKPDPNAPKITRPCTECGKRFWSWKALFGHMRCHPERQWRGINPPPNLRSQNIFSDCDFESEMTEEDNEVAACLVMLSTTPTAIDDRTQSFTSTSYGEFHPSDTSPVDEPPVIRDADCAGPSWRSFECTSCKKVFGSHQALGGHRATHKNVKGCFAITRNGSEVEDEHMTQRERESNAEEKTALVLGGAVGHRCSICMRVFSSGQALGGHKRCHWEKGEDQPLLLSNNNLDLNMPPPLEDDYSSSSYSSNLPLDLRLTL